MHNLFKLIKNKTILLVVCFSFCHHLSNAQLYSYYDGSHYEPNVLLEANVHTGIMNCITDLGGSKKVNPVYGTATLKNSHISGGIGITATWRDVLAARLDINYGKVESHDSLLKNASEKSSYGRYQRNLNFRSSIAEATLMVEFHPLFLFSYVNGDKYPPRLSPYLVGGVGYMFFNPQAYYKNTWIDVAPLRLEGQGFTEYPNRKIYKKSTSIIPVGAGLRYEANYLLTIKVEGIFRATGTDYLDDVSEGPWVDPLLFQKYLGPAQANLAAQLYNRSKISPPQDTRPRGSNKSKDYYWGIQMKLGFALNRSLRR